MAEPDLPGVVLNQEYRVKLGKSFTFPKENAFHTIKCEPLDSANSFRPMYMYNVTLIIEHAVE